MGESGFTGEDDFGDDGISCESAFGWGMVGVVSVEGVWCSGDG